MATDPEQPSLSSIEKVLSFFLIFSFFPLFSHLFLCGCWEKWDLMIVGCLIIFFADNKCVPKVTLITPTHLLVSLLLSKQPSKGQFFQCLRLLLSCWEVFKY